MADRKLTLCFSLHQSFAACRGCVPTLSVDSEKVSGISPVILFLEIQKLFLAFGAAAERKCQKRKVEMTFINLQRAICSVLTGQEG